MQGILEVQLIEDLKKIGVPTDFHLVIKNYSSTYYGNYNPNNETVTLYRYEDNEGKHPYRYEHLLDILIHEAVHHIQWSDPNFVRYKGVMHDSDFYKLYNKYTGIASALRLFKEVKTSEKKSRKPKFNIKGSTHHKQVACFRKNSVHHS